MKIQAEKSIKDFLLEDNEILKTLIDYFPAGIVILDINGDILFSNNKGNELFGLREKDSPVEKLNYQHWHLISKDNIRIATENNPIIKAFKERELVKISEIGIVNGKEVAWTNITVTPLPSGDAVLVTCYDISDELKWRNELESSNKKLKEMLDDKDKFYRIIAHDIKNPFTTIFGCTDFLLENFSDYSPEYVKTFVQLISESARQTYKLLDNLMIWSCAHEGLMEFQPEYTDVSSLVDEAKDFVKNNSNLKKVIFYLDLDKNCTAYIDKNMISFVTRNLITNAVKYSRPNGDIQITVKDLTENILISVRDYGIGIDKKISESIFNTIITTPGTNNEKGFGFGLMISKELIDKHNGKIWFESTPGIGSEFFIRLPRGNQAA